MSQHLIDQLRSFVLSSSDNDYASTSRQLRTLSPLLTQREHDSIVRATLADINGLGPLQRHLDNPRVKEVMVVGGTNVFVEDHIWKNH
jgi:Flp pilus assembly CpaF family ATPase